MCRLVTVVAEQVTEFGLVLKEAPRSLARLSSEHPDGWGVAAHCGDDSLPPPSFSAEGAGVSQHEGGWRVHKGTARASDCHHFQAIAARSAGTVLIAHVRQKTVGPTRIENTHPFLRDGWVFAHNGTVKDLAYLEAQTSPTRRAEVQGDTDSERLFAFFLSKLDGADLLRTVSSTGARREEATRVFATATADLRRRAVGAFNFVLSNGSSCFVHRFGRSLYLLERRPDADREESSTSDLTTRWTKRRHAILVASERLTDEPWQEIAEGTLLRLDRSPKPSVSEVVA